MLLDEDIEHLSDFVDAQSINYIIQYGNMVILLIVYNKNCIKNSSFIFGITSTAVTQ